MFRNIFSRALMRHPKNRSLLKNSVDSITNHRQIHCGVYLRNPRQTSKPNSTSPAIASKYQVINEDNSTVIENTAEEIHSESPYPILNDEFDGINMQS